MSALFADVELDAHLLNWVLIIGGSLTIFGVIIKGFLILHKTLNVIEEKTTKELSNGGNLNGDVNKLSLKDLAQQSVLAASDAKLAAERNGNALEQHITWSENYVHKVDEHLRRLDGHLIRVDTTLDEIRKKELAELRALRGEEGQV